MRIVSNAMLIVSGVYLALGLIYLRFWWAERARLAYLAFTISCFSYMIFSWFEMGMMHSRHPKNIFFTHGGPFSRYCRHYLICMVCVSSFTRTQMAFLGPIAAMRILALILHLIMANGIHFRQITSVGSRTVLGETLSYPIAVPNPWMVLPHFCTCLAGNFFPRREHSMLAAR